MLKAFLSGLTIGGVGAWLSMQYHLVRTDEGHVVVPRIHQPPMRSAYVDVRHWSPAMWQHYPELTDALAHAGRADLMESDGSSTASVVPVAPASASGLQALIPTQVSRTVPQFRESEMASVPVPVPEARPARATPPMPARMGGLPSLQHPTPAGLEQGAALRSGAPAASAGEHKDWVRDLLQSLSPQANGASSATTSAALPAERYEIAAPRPMAGAYPPVEPVVDWAFPVAPQRLDRASIKPY